MIAEVQRELPRPIEAATLTAEIARLAGREIDGAHSGEDGESERS